MFKKPKLGKMRQGKVGKITRLGVEEAEFENKNIHKTRYCTAEGEILGDGIIECKSWRELDIGYLDGLRYEG